MSFLLSAAVFLVPLGKLADIWGRKRMLFYGNLFFTFSTLLCAFSTTGTMLTISRFLQGIGSAMALSSGMAIIVAGLILLVFLTANTGNTYLIATLFVLGFGFGLFSSPNTNSVMSSVEKKYLGTASATLVTMRLTGQMFSMAIAAMAIHVFIGNNTINAADIPGFMQSVKVIFIAFAGLCTLGVFASLARGKKTPHAVAN